MRIGEELGKLWLTEVPGVLQKRFVWTCYTKILISPAGYISWNNPWQPCFSLGPSFQQVVAQEALCPWSARVYVTCIYIVMFMFMQMLCLQCIHVMFACLSLLEPIFNILWVEIRRIISMLYHVHAGTCQRTCQPCMNM